MSKRAWRAVPRRAHDGRATVTQRAETRARPHKATIYSATTFVRGALEGSVGRAASADDRARTRTTLPAGSVVWGEPKLAFVSAPCATALVGSPDLKAMIIAEVDDYYGQDDGFPRLTQRLPFLGCAYG